MGEGAGDFVNAVHSWASQRSLRLSTYSAVESFYRRDRRGLAEIAEKSLLRRFL